MKSFLIGLIERGLEKKVSATGLALFRILFGLVILQEIIYLTYFRHLIFDQIPYINTAGPIVAISLALWFCIALGLILGLFTFVCAIVNYLFWVLFVLLTPMWRDFDGGFDQLMTSSSFILIFVRSDRRLSLDNLRRKLRSQSAIPVSASEVVRTPVIYYFVLIGVSLGLLYFDAALHKMHSEIWMNGLGAWVPNTMPYYISPLDFDWFVNSRWLQELVGYSLTAFQLAFLFVFTRRAFRVPLLVFGAAFHLGIIFCLNIYPFGFGMLVHYVLLVPFSWWAFVENKIVYDHPAIQTYCNARDQKSLKTGLFLEHFDFRNYSTFHFVTNPAELPPALREYQPDFNAFTLISLDRENRIYEGLEAFNQKWFFRLSLFGLFFFEVWRRFAYRVSSGFCASFRRFWVFARHEKSKVPQRETTVASEVSPTLLYRFLILVFFLQLNSTLYYGISKRFEPGERHAVINETISELSVYVTSISHILLGITPHALYMDDHFGGYELISAFTYIDSDGKERWVPFVASDGRFLPPNWGRVHSMWANVAMHPPFNKAVFERLAQKVTAYWAEKLGIGTKNSIFHIKTKPVEISYHWIKDLRRKNLQQNWSEFGQIRWVDRKFSIRYTDEGAE